MDARRSGLCAVGREILVDGAWVADPEGCSGGRQRRRSGEVFRALLGGLPRNPVTLYSLAWRMLPETSLSDGTSLLDVARIPGPQGDFTGIPVEGSRDADDWWPRPMTRPELPWSGLGWLGDVASERRRMDDAAQGVAIRRKRMSWDQPVAWEVETNRAGGRGTSPPPSSMRR